MRTEKKTIPSSQIFGTGFVNHTGLLFCRFGENNVVAASFASSRLVRCLAPAQSLPGAVDIAVSIDGGVSFGQASDYVAGHFRYIAPSFVNGLSPRSGPDTGGTVITVLGAGFNDDFHLSCSFQGGTQIEDASNTRAIQVMAVVLSASELTCIAPPVTSSTELGREVGVVVSVDFGDGFLTPLPSVFGTSSTPLVFTYAPRVHLSVLNPARGPATGGTVVDIGGANFLPSGMEEVHVAAVGGPTIDTVWCMFASTMVIGYRLSDGLMRCSSPPRALGALANVEVSISVNSGADFARGPPGSELVRQKLC